MKVLLQLLMIHQLPQLYYLHLLFVVIVHDVLIALQSQRILFQEQK